MSFPYPSRIALFGAVICFLAFSSVSGQPEKAAERSIARELSKAEASDVLGVPAEYVDSLSKEKTKIPGSELESFRYQFGRLQNGLPTFQVKRGVYFVLIPLDHLAKQPLVQAKDKTPVRALPPTVDHRKEQTPVRNQGERGTCTAFAACGELEAILKRGKKQDRLLCTNLAYYWFMKDEGSKPCDDPGIQTFRAADYLQKHLVCEDKHWPYVGTDPSKLRADGKCSDIDIPAAKVEGEEGWGIKDFLLLPAGKEVKADGSIDIKDTLTLERLLVEDHDIVFGTIVAWNTRDAKEIIDVRLGPAGQPIFGAGGHALVIVGYDKTNPNKSYFIVKNSWGKDYGHAGYLYLSYDYIRTYARYGYVTRSIKSGKIAGAVAKKEAKGEK